MENQDADVVEAIAGLSRAPYQLHHEGTKLWYAVPDRMRVQEVDYSSQLEHPLRKQLKPVFSDIPSFVAYVGRHKTESTVAWCKFDPQTSTLSFAAVMDDHAGDVAGWREHIATFRPDTSAEWKEWLGKNRQSFSQVDFAQWIQDHEQDIVAPDGLPNSADMLKMATDFLAQEDHSFKSAVRLQSGGVQMEYIADATNGTVERMKLFERFAIGIPVFQHQREAWSLTARLKYRAAQGKVAFTYELMRPEKVHQAASEELIAKVREGLGAVPLLMGGA